MGPTQAKEASNEEDEARSHEASSSDGEGEGEDDVKGCRDSSDGDVGSSNEESSEHTSGTSRSSRKRALADRKEELYYVPALIKYHKTWKQFENYLKEYQRERLTILAICETQNVRLRNRQIAKLKSNVGKSVSELPVIPEQLDPYQRVYICAHGWTTRNRSKGLRPRHKVNGIGCPMRFRAQVVRRSTGQWRIEVKLAFYGHCHSVSEEIYLDYPSVRRFPKDEPVMSDAELMVTSGRRASKIYDYIRERSSHYVQLKDVYNMIASIKGSGGNQSDEDWVAELLVNFELDALGNVSAVDENAKGQTADITFSSRHMRKMYNGFQRSF